MTKNVVMLIGLAAVFAAGVACFGLFTSDADRSKGSQVEACAGLSGQAKIDCEKRQKP